MDIKDRAELTLSTPKIKKYILPTSKEKCITDVVRIAKYYNHFSYG